jgi:hypothetical protein
LIKLQSNGVTEDQILHLYTITIRMLPDPFTSRGLVQETQLLIKY